MISVIKRVNLLFIAFIFLAGCTRYVPSPANEEATNLPQLQMIQDWTLSLLSLSSQNNLQTYEIKLTYKGDTKAENIVIETGNATTKLSFIEKNQYTFISSSRTSIEAQIQVTVTWNEGNQGFKQTVLFDVRGGQPK